MHCKPRVSNRSFWNCVHKLLRRVLTLRNSLFYFCFFYIKKIKNVRSIVLKFTLINLFQILKYFFFPRTILCYVNILLAAFHFFSLFLSVRTHCFYVIEKCASKETHMFIIRNRIKTNVFTTRTTPPHVINVVNS